MSPSRTTKIAALGGSSPFTAALIDAIAEQAHRLPRCELCLFGRDQGNLALIERYAALRLRAAGWLVRATTDLQEAAAEAHIVIHQIRYGGLAGRKLDEELAVACGAAVDETLGPGALHALLRALPSIRKVARELSSLAPDAWVLNLTNPLSAVSAVMLDQGVRNCVGLCELPSHTAAQAAALFGINSSELAWEYAGLNHRGFLVKLQHGDRDLLRELPLLLNGNSLNGITASQIRNLGALPTKYFRVISGLEKPGEGRAENLAALRAQIASELAVDASTTPASLSQRYTGWYPESVVPMLIALCSATASRQIVNVPLENGLVEEVHAMVSQEAMKPIPAASQPSTKVAAWLDAYRNHERSVLTCVTTTSPSSIEAALALDPVTSRVSLKSVAAAIWQSLQKNQCEFPKISAEE